MTSYDSLILAKNPSHYYRLSEASGLTMYDSSGFHRDATLIQQGGVVPPSIMNDTGLLTGDPNGAITLNGGGNFIKITDDNSLDGLTALSMVALIKPSSADITNSPTTPTEIVARDGGSTNRAFQFRIASSKLSFVKIPSATATCTGATTLVAGNAYHCGMSWDGSVLRVFLNGAQDGSPVLTSGTGGMGTFAQDTLIGRRQPDGTFTGTIDEVAIFANQCLTPGDFADFYSGSSTAPSTNHLTGVWGMAS